MERGRDPEEQLERTGDELEERLHGVDDDIDEAGSQAGRAAEHNLFDDPEAVDEDEDE